MVRTFDQVGPGMPLCRGIPITSILAKASGITYLGLAREHPVAGAKASLVRRSPGHLAVRNTVHLRKELLLKLVALACKII